MFKAPEIEIVRFEIADVITTSSEINGGNSGTGDFGGGEEEEG